MSVSVIDPDHHWKCKSRMYQRYMHLADKLRVLVIMFQAVCGIAHVTSILGTLSWRHSC